MKNDEVRGILLAGVGGQGILRASDILCHVMIEAGYDTKKSEVHGMAQRGGCVTSHVRYGSKVYSPIARKGDIEILVSFERLETIRYLDYLKSSAIIIMNDEVLNPPAVNLGNAVYPDNINSIILKNFKTLKIIKARDIAAAAGDERAANTVVLGALSSYLEFDNSLWEKVIRNSFSEKLANLNIRAFHLGQSS
jgi:indolepyruvate ferredoxin oxidoreductase, beta subunit